jgi:tetratricopeptide (TPR) repeat protein
MNTIRRTVIAAMALPWVWVTAPLGAQGPAPEQPPSGSAPSGGGSTSSAPSGSPQQQSAPATAAQSSFLGRDLPFLDPGSEIVTWDGRSWNINNNRLFEARFEKFLNAPASATASDSEYQGILSKIMDNMAPNRVTKQSTDQAFQLLAKASEFGVDANLCDAIANQVYSSWLSRRSKDHLASANKALEDERKRLEWNAQITAQGNPLDGTRSGSSDTVNAEMQKQAQLRRDMQMQPILTRLAEVNALLKANQLKSEVAELQVKIEFQALILQLFLQRRFQHVVIATRFYRSIFNDGDSQLRVGDDAKSLFAKTSGLPPTLGTLDSMANEIMRDVREGIAAFSYLLEQNELESATKRLAETFLIGEYLPEVRTLDRDKKRRALAFAQSANQLVSAIEVKDYALAEKLVGELAETAKDFDSSKPMAAIETAKTVSAMHLAKARNAAVSGDRETLEAELRAATEIWPRNPALTEVSTMIFSQADVQGRALVDFDQLLGQQNFRQIYDDRMRFIAATAMHPEKQEQLREVLEAVASVEAAIIRAQEIQKRGDFAGAWESTERTFRQFPDDNKLNQLRSDLTTRASEFVSAIRQAEELETRGQHGSSLAWFLKAQRAYPPSEFAREGIERLTKEILPDAS